MRDNMSTPSSYQTEPSQRGPALRRRFLPLPLITLGVVLLFGNLIPERNRGGLIVLGLVAYWPMALVLLGLWLLFRDHLPPSLRRPIATVGSISLLAYGILAAAATAATGGELARTDRPTSFSPSAWAESITLVAPIATG